jgi:hypothetical protein
MSRNQQKNRTRLERLDKARLRKPTGRILKSRIHSSPEAMQWVRSRHFWRDNGFDSGDVIENEINEVVGRVSEFEKGRGRVWWQVFSPRFGRKRDVD